jgi:hypothetical protein
MSGSGSQPRRNSYRSGSRWPEVIAGKGLRAVWSGGYPRAKNGVRGLMHSLFRDGCLHSILPSIAESRLAQSALGMDRLQPFKRLHTGYSARIALIGSTRSARSDGAKLLAPVMSKHKAADVRRTCRKKPARPGFRQPGSMNDEDRREQTERSSKEKTALARVQPICLLVLSRSRRSCFW